MESKPKSHARPAFADALPPEIRRGAGRRIFVDFEGRFEDGTAFRRSREFDPDELKKAVNFLDKAKADFARGNGVGRPLPEDAVMTTAMWCEHCVNVAMPAQRNGNRPKYSDEALQGFREVVRRHIAPRLGSISLEELDKKSVDALMAGLPNDALRAQTLNVLTRIMGLAESKGKRKKGTNPCKGVRSTREKG